MYRHQPVMEADGELVWWIGFVLDPISRIVKRLAERNLDQMRSNANIAFCCPVFSGPAPDSLEHAKVQAL